MTEQKEKQEGGSLVDQQGADEPFEVESDCGCNGGFSKSYCLWDVFMPHIGPHGLLLHDYLCHARNHEDVPANLPDMAARLGIPATKVREAFKLLEEVSLARKVKYSEPSEDDPYVMQTRVRWKLLDEFEAARLFRSRQKQAIKTNQGGQ